MATTVLVTDDFRAWYGSLTEAAQESVRRAIGMLEVAGTALGFPYSSAIKGSVLAMRELRVQHMGEPYRVLYVFDPVRQAVLLVGGNKAGDGKRWYQTAVRLAEQFYDDYLKEIGLHPTAQKGNDMAVTRWKELQDKVSPERRAQIKKEAEAELDRVGYAAVRKARAMTQVELAEKLGVSQASVAGLEARTDLQLSTLAKYVRALGGELEIRAVFPEATFHLDPPASAKPASLKQVNTAKRSRSRAKAA